MSRIRISVVVTAILVLCIGSSQTIAFADTAAGPLAPEAKQPPDNRSRPGKPKLLAITVAPGSASLVAGYSQRFELYGRWSDGSTTEITTGAEWVSRDPSIASIDPQGQVTAESVGTTQIVGTYGKLSATATLSVVTPDPSAASVPTHNAQIDLGDVYVGQTSTYVTSITNNGNVPLHSRGIGVDGGGDSVWSVQESTCGTTLQVGEQCSVTLAFSPKGNLSYYGRVYYFFEEIPAITCCTISFDGTGYGSTDTLSAVTSPPNLSHIDLGDVQVGETATYTTSITNTGTKALTFTGAGADTPPEGAWRTFSSTCGATLAPAQSCSVVIAFTPPGNMTYENGRVHYFFEEIPSGTGYIIGFSGTGFGGPNYLAASSPPNNTNVDLGSVKVGESVIYPTYVTNLGDTALTINRAGVDSNLEGAWSMQSSTCGQTLAVGETCAVTLRFSPNSTVSSLGRVYYFFDEIPAIVGHIVYFTGSGY